METSSVTEFNFFPFSDALSEERRFKKMNELDLSDMNKPEFRLYSKYYVQNRHSGYNETQLYIFVKEVRALFLERI